MTILVTGATGNIGRKVVDELIVRGITEIRALTNHPEKADLPESVHVVEGFIGKPQTLDGVFDGVLGMYLAPYEPTAAEVLRMAKDADVPYVVALSGSHHWQALTDTVFASGVPATVLGPGEFIENLAGWAPEIRASGTVSEPYPDAGSAPIAMDDIAAVAAALLSMSEAERDHYVGEMLELTGPEYLTRPEMLAQIGEGIGRQLEFRQIDRADAEERLRPVLGDQAGWYLDLQEQSRHHPQQATAEVDVLAGRPGSTVRQWAELNPELFG